MTLRLVGRNTYTTLNGKLIRPQDIVAFGTGELESGETLWTSTLDKSSLPDHQYCDPKEYGRRHAYRTIPRSLIVLFYDYKNRP
jgi:hypothetical protein